MVTTKELQWSATSAERRKFEGDFQAERMAGLVRGFPNIAVFRDRPPNGSRLSSGRSARGRKAVEPQKQRLGGEARQFFPQERPAASSAC